MSREGILAASVVGFIFLACATSVFSDPAQKDDLVIARLGLAAILTGVISLVYFLGKLYCSYWLKLSGKSKILPFMETAVVPFVTTAIIPGLSRAWEGKQWTRLSVYLLLFAVLMDLPRAYRATIESWFPELRPGDRILFLQFPPRARIDMLPMDIACAALVAYLFLRHLN